MVIDPVEGKLKIKPDVLGLHSSPSFATLARWLRPAPRSAGRRRRFAPCAIAAALASPPSLCSGRLRHNGGFIKPTQRRFAPLPLSLGCVAWLLCALLCLYRPCLFFCGFWLAAAPVLSLRSGGAATRISSARGRVLPPFSVRFLSGASPLSSPCGRRSRNLKGSRLRRPFRLKPCARTCAPERRCAPYGGFPQMGYFPATTFSPVAAPSLALRGRPGVALRRQDPRRLLRFASWSPRGTSPPRPSRGALAQGLNRGANKAHEQVFVLLLVTPLWAFLCKGFATAAR